MRVLLHARVQRERLGERRRVVARAPRVLQLCKEPLQLRQDVPGAAALGGGAVGNGSRAAAAAVVLRRRPVPSSPEAAPPSAAAGSASGSLHWKMPRRKARFMKRVCSSEFM